MGVNVYPRVPQFPLFQTLLPFPLCRPFIYSHRFHYSDDSNYFMSLRAAIARGGLGEAMSPPQEVALVSVARPPEVAALKMLEVQ